MNDVLGRLKASLKGRYEVQREIGQGGMASVFLAVDLKHHRNVALKVLRPDFGAILGGDRFLKEIEVTANLQHPNILPLYDSGETEGFLFYVMPLLEGETLRQKLDRERQLPIDEVVGIVESVAAALDYAHRQGIIHRDIKPSNILLHEGQALVADFGIALAMSRVGKETRLTETGFSVGSPGYMSPEQAMGEQELDARSDVYSLGAVTFEMLVGEPPHVGKTPQAVVAKILSETPPPVRRTRELVPANVEAAVAKALARSPADRFSKATDFSAALSNPGFRLMTDEASPPSPVPSVRGVWRSLAVAGFGVAILALILGAWGWLRPPPVQPVGRYNLAFLPGQELLVPNQISFDVGRGGDVIVYVGPGDERNQLWVKRRGSVEAYPLSGTEGAMGPSISPDGSEVAFRSEGSLLKVPLEGGPAVRLADTVSSHPAAWLDDGSLIYTRGLPTIHLRRIPPEGSDPEAFGAFESDSLFHFFPSPLPDSRGVLFTKCFHTCNEAADLWVLDLRKGTTRQLVSGALRGWYLESGHLVFVRADGGVFGVPFSVESLQVTGTAVPLFEGVRVDGGFPRMALSSDGTLLMVEGAGRGIQPDRQIVRVSREGVARPVDPTWRVSIEWNHGWSLSPDGTRLAIGLRTSEGDDVFIKDLVEGSLYRLTYDPAQDGRPQWSSDGKTVYFIHYEGGQSNLFQVTADGTGSVRPVLERESPIWQYDWTPDGGWLVARVGGTIGMTGARSIVAYHMEGDTTAVPIIDSAYDEVSPRLSPDGRWLAYASKETGDWEVFVRPFPDVAAGRKRIVSRGGGYMPLWAHSGRELFYATTDRDLIAVKLEGGPEFEITGRQRLFAIPPDISLGFLRVAYDIMPGDQEFIMLRDLPVREYGAPTVILVENWLGELRAQMRGH